MSVAATTGNITSQTLTYLPSVFAGVQAAELSSASGPSKLQAVLDGIQAGSGALAGSSTNADIAGVAALVNLTVSILNALGVFKKKAPGK